MPRDQPINLAASIGQRLRNVAREKHTTVDLILRRYAVERLLYRLSQSRERNRFVLKGAMLFTAWVDDPFRPTRDVDFLAFGDNATPAMAAAFGAICQQNVPDDGLIFDVASIRAEPIREQQEYQGVRIRITAQLGRTRIPVQVDIGFGDVITPGAVDLTFPALLNAPAPQLRAYPKETVIAEKFEAIVDLGQANTRMKDYYDIIALSRLFEFDGDVLRTAIGATFERRETALPARRPSGLTKAFARDIEKVRLWTAFLQREQLLLNPGDLIAAIQEISNFVMPPTKAARSGEAFDRIWRARGPWRVKHVPAAKVAVKGRARRSKRVKKRSLAA
jgi:predicted nucleotidyltransferase component of viral defense system